MGIQGHLRKERRPGTFVFKRIKKKVGENCILIMMLHDKYSSPNIIK